MLTEKLRDSEGDSPVGTERTLRLQGEERRGAQEGRAHGAGVPLAPCALSVLRPPPAPSLVTYPVPEV